MSSTVDMMRDRVGTCGYADTQSGDPCSQAALYTDDRCAWHTETDERKDGAAPSEKVATTFPKSTHQRMKAHQRADETLAGVIERGLDALEREDRLPDAVTEVLRE